jgi:hypothetical protein
MPPSSKISPTTLHADPSRDDCTMARPVPTEPDRVAGKNPRYHVGVIFAVMSITMHRWIAIATLPGAAVSSQFTPAPAWADLHNITYIARIDGLAPGGQAAFITNNNQTNIASLGAMPGDAFQANTVLADPTQAGMQVTIKWPYSATVHCEIDVDDNVAAQIDQFVKPVSGNADPMNGVVPCGAPLIKGSATGLPAPTNGIGPVPSPTVSNPPPKVLGNHVV